MRRAPRLTVLLVVGLLAAACGSGGSDSSTSGTTPDGSEPFTVEQAEASPEEDVQSALVPGIEGDWTPLVDVNEIISGGPPPDGIPAIDEPRFLRAGDVGFLDDREPVIVVEIEGEARAYPLQVMTWHEIVNDTIAGVPVAVTYCPLCNTAVAFDRRTAGRTVTFGTSGMLYRSALVMYDRQTESLWTHFNGQAVVGTLTGTDLERFPAPIVSWETFREAHPTALVLSRETGFERDYGRNPYPGYDDVDSPPFLYRGEVDGRLAAKERILGIALGDEAVAIQLEPLAEAGVLDLTVDDRQLVALHQPGTASALDRSDVSGGRDIGATGVFERQLDGRTLSFERTAGGFRDQETSSTWNILGRATAGPLEGSQLERVPAVDTFWFAWGAYQPDTRLLP
jgi:hypothetical protein